MDKDPKQSIMNAVQIAATKDIIESQVAKYLDRLPNHIDDILYKTTLTALGLRETHRGMVQFDSKGGWLEEFFTTTISQVASEQIAEYVNVFVRDAIRDKNLMLDIKKAIYRIYKETMIAKLNDAVTARAKDDADNCVAALAKRLTYNANQDPADPESFQGPLGEIILKQLAKNIVDEDDNHGVIGYDGEDFTLDDEIPF